MATTKNNKKNRRAKIMPSKKTSNERTEQIHLRVTPEEKKEIEDRAKKSGKTVARYLVGLSTTRHIVNPSRLCQLIFQIKRAGVNINEIVTVANTNKFANAEMIARVEQQEKEIQKLLQKILDELYDTEEHSIEKLEEILEGLNKKIDRQTQKIEKLERKINPN